MEPKNNKKDNNLDKNLDKFLNTVTNNQEMDCSSGVCVIKGDKSIVERVNKKIITDDGRELLM